MRMSGAIRTLIMSFANHLAGQTPASSVRPGCRSGRRRTGRGGPFLDAETTPSSSGRRRPEPQSGAGLKGVAREAEAEPGGKTVRGVIFHGFSAEPHPRPPEAPEKESTAVLDISRDGGEHWVGHDCARWVAVVAPRVAPDEGVDAMQLGREVAWVGSWKALVRPVSSFGEVGYFLRFGHFHPALVDRDCDCLRRAVGWGGTHGPAERVVDERWVVGRLGLWGCLLAPRYVVAGVTVAMHRVPDESVMRVADNTPFPPFARGDEDVGGRVAIGVVLVLLIHRSEPRVGVERPERDGCSARALDADDPASVDAARFLVETEGACVLTGADVQVQILEQRDQRSVSLLHSYVFRLYCGVAFPEGDNRGGGCGDEQCDEYRDGGADEAPGASLLVEVLADQFFHTLAVDRGCKARDRVPKGGVGAEIDVGSPGAEVDIVRFGRERFRK